MYSPVLTVEYAFCTHPSGCDHETPEEMLALAREGGYELTDEQLDSIAGGKNWDGSQDCYYVLCLACKSKVSWKVEDSPPVHRPYCTHQGAMCPNMIDIFSRNLGRARGPKGHNEKARLYHG